MGDDRISQQKLSSSHVSHIALALIFSNSRSIC
jgi:hypothetical protein